MRICQRLQSFHWLVPPWDLGLDETTASCVLLCFTGVLASMRLRCFRVCFSFFLSLFWIMLSRQPWSSCYKASGAVNKFNNSWSSLLESCRVLLKYRNDAFSSLSLLYTVQCPLFMTSIKIYNTMIPLFGVKGTTPACILAPTAGLTQ